jgi:thiol:disulfide interchange protein
MVDFSANWCLTCKYNLIFAVDTRRIRALVKKNRVVPLLADWTDESPMIKEALNKLGYNSIPLLAIWPAGAADEDVIILTDVLLESEVIEALEQAGPSRP